MYRQAKFPLLDRRGRRERLFLIASVGVVDQLILAQRSLFLYGAATPPVQEGNSLADECSSLLLGQALKPGWQTSAATRLNSDALRATPCPSTRMAGDFRDRACCAIVSTVPNADSSSCQVPREMMAAGRSAGQPFRSSHSAIFGVRAKPIITTTEPPASSSVRAASHSCESKGSDWGAARTMKPCETPRSVRKILADPGTAVTLLTPG